MQPRDPVKIPIYCFKTDLYKAIKNTVLMALALLLINVINRSLLIKSLSYFYRDVNHDGLMGC